MEVLDRCFPVSIVAVKDHHSAEPQKVGLGLRWRKCRHIRDSKGQVSLYYWSCVYLWRPLLTPHALWIYKTRALTSLLPEPSLLILYTSSLNLKLPIDHVLVGASVGHDSSVIEASPAEEIIHPSSPLFHSVPTHDVISNTRRHHEGTPLRILNCGWRHFDLLWPQQDYEVRMR